MDDGVLLIIITYFVVAVIIVTIVLNVIQKSRKKSIKREIENLDKEKNIIASTPVMSELSKVEPIVKNEKMEEKYKSWQRRFEVIKNERIAKINDMLIDIDLFIDSDDHKALKLKIAKTEMEIYKARLAAENLLNEVKEVTVSEEKYRSIITKLKTKYRELTGEFEKHKNDYDEIKDAIELQFENIENRFQEFEISMENNEYTEVIHVVKALDTMLEHMKVVIEEVPNLMLLAKQFIPKRIEEIAKINSELTEKGYSLDYLNIEYNLEEAKKNVTSIVGRIKVLNLEECLFELKTILDYLDSLFLDFEKEKISRKNFDENKRAFAVKLSKVNKLVGDIYLQIDDIKRMYDLKDKDIAIINEIKEKLLTINENYVEILTRLKKREVPYSKVEKELETLSNHLKQIEEELDDALKTLGSLYDDELRAREQLTEIQKLLKDCKTIIRSYKLPIITNNYFVELAEANEAINEIVKELDKKPIVIKTLNMRVDTARDLVLKLYNTTTEMIKTAQIAEFAMIYGNRFRTINENVNIGLTNAEVLYYKGNYKGSLEVVCNALELVDPDFNLKLKELSKN